MNTTGGKIHRNFDHLMLGNEKMLPNLAYGGLLKRIRFTALTVIE
jgi:hypothetical protein